VDSARSQSECTLLRHIHRELGLAGWFAGCELPEARRHARLADAHQRADRIMTAAQRLGALAITVINGEGAIVQQIANGNLGEHLVRAHEHVLSAAGLLAAHIESNDS
jgi:hypothetical protein